MGEAGGADSRWPGAQEQLLAALSCAPLILFATDRAGELTFLQGRGLDALGLEPDRLLGKSIFELCSPSISDLEPRFEQALAGEVLHAVFEWSGRVFEAEYQPLRDEGGRVTGLIGVANDVTEQTEIEAEMARRDRVLLTLQSAGAAITSSLDLQVVLETVTREMADLLQMKACAIWRWKESTRDLRLLAHHGPEAWWNGKLSSGKYDPLDFSSTQAVLVAQRGRQIAPDQADLSLAERDFLQEAGIHILLRLPMVYQDRVMGLVEVMDDRPDRLVEEVQVDLAQLLANQAASAIENARLYDAVRRHIAEVTTLNRISQVITSILDLDETLAIIADHVLWLLDVAAASVILHDDRSDELWFGAASGEGAEFIRGKRLTGEQGIVTWVVQQGEPLLVPDVTQDPRFYGDWDRESGFSTRSILCVPLQTKGRTIGAIEAVNKASGDFDTEDLSLLTSMAASAAIAIENAQLYEQAQQEISERRRAEARLRNVNRALRTMSECHEALVWARDEAQLLDDVCRILVEIGGHRMAWVGFAEHDDEKRVRVLASAGHDEGYLETLELTWDKTPRGRGPTGTAIRRRRPCLVRDMRSDPRFAPWREEALAQGYGSSIALPLIAEGKMLGALNIYAGEPDAFDEEEVELLKELANDLAFGLVALRTRAERDRAEDEIRRLYRELRDHASNLEQVVAERTRELRAERDRTQAILEAVGEAVIVTDLEGTIRYLNPAAVELTGYSAEEAVGRKPRLWQPEEPQVRGGRSDLAAEIPMQRGEVVSRRKDGTLYDAAMTVAPLLDSQAGDQPVGWVCVQRDITPIKEAERLKDEFVSNVSHELRTPLSVITLISGNLERLYDRLDDERRRKMIHDIRDQADTLNDLVADILEISRIESGRISMERERLDLARLLAREVEKQGLLAKNKSQSLQVECTPGLLVWGNANQLRQVIRNLLSNAIKFTPEGGQILCECRALASGGVSDAKWPEASQLPAGRWAALRVVDTGIGIAEEDLPHLYERFYRVEAQSTVAGTGLGLSIARELVQLHNGSIAATSVLGQGSTFAIYLPLWEG